MISWKASIATAITFASCSAVYVAESQSVAMDFDKCLQIIRGTSTDLGVAPINIAETDVLRIVRYVTEDGSVLITCSKPDRKMVITKSD